MPDNAGYKWLGRFLATADEWTDEDIAAARSLVENQRHAVRDAHPTDDKGR